MKAIIILLTTVFLSTCSNSNKSQELVEIIGKEFQVVEINKNDISAYNLTMNLEENEARVSGFAGCNNYFGSYSINNDGISFSKIAATKKYCQEINNVESSFLKSLSNVTHYKQAKNGNIELLDENDTVLVVLKQ